MANGLMVVRCCESGLEGRKSFENRNGKNMETTLGIRTVNAVRIC